MEIQPASTIDFPVKNHKSGTLPRKRFGVPSGQLSECPHRAKTPRQKIDPGWWFGTFVAK